MLTIKQSIKLSVIIDKLDIKINNAKGSQEEVGADLIMQVVRKVHRAEKEIYEFVADKKKISVKEAEDVDIVEFFTELFSDEKVITFFKSAVKSKVQESSNSILASMT